MVEAHAQHSDAINAFHKWRGSSEAQLPGIGGPRFETVPFIPKSNLEEYFDRPRHIDNLLDGVLDRQERPAVDSNYVREHYLQSFAILLCIGEGRLIHHFQQHKSLRDEKLPYRAKPDEFPFTTPDKFEDFKKAQWQFCASQLEYGMSEGFKEEDILPITHKERIGEGGSAVIYKIVVDESYNSLRPGGHDIPRNRRHYNNTFVLKTYRTAEAEENYKAERDAYMKLRWSGRPSPYIIAYYGGFVHGKSYNIILEFADQGTLETFMQKTKSPSSPEETLLLWDRLSNVTHGVMTIHGKIRDDSSASQILSGIHQDIKPANVLVFSGNGNSPYDCHFKIADLGLAHFRPSSSQPNDSSSLDAFGTRAYGAPETFRFHAGTEAAPLQVTKEVDMWSIGCVFSEVSVWAHHGWKRVIEYRRQRSEEIEAKGGGGGEHIFHFDDQVLDTVDNIHQDMLGKNTVKHLITRKVLDRLVNELLLLQHESRLSAKQVFDRSKRLVKECEKRLGVSVIELGGSANGVSVDSDENRIKAISSRKISHEHHRSHAERDSQLEQTPPPDDDLTPSSSSSASQSSPHKHHHKSASQNSKARSFGNTEDSQLGGQASHVVSSAPVPPPTASNPNENASQQHTQPLQEEPVRPTLSVGEGHAWKVKKKNGGIAILPGSENLTSLNKRDHIFLIDNSATMKEYRGSIVHVISLLAYMLKKSDENGLDIFFTQTVTKVNSKKSSKLSTPINQEPFQGISDMRGRLQNILQEHVNKFGTLYQPPRPLFRPQPPPEAQRPLSFYILTDAKWQPTDVGGLIKDVVQSMKMKNCPKEHVAIQFIRFGEDRACIDKLDELDHGLGLKASGMDIVDHTYWNGNVWKMLLGALNDWYDDDPTEPQHLPLATLSITASSGLGTVSRI